MAATDSYWEEVPTSIMNRKFCCVKITRPREMKYKRWYITAKYIPVTKCMHRHKDFFTNLPCRRLIRASKRSARSFIQAVMFNLELESTLRRRGGKERTIRVIFTPHPHPLLIFSLSITPFVKILFLFPALCCHSNQR